MKKTEYHIDGNQINSFDDFISTINALKIFPLYEWNGNLDAFNDLLRSGFGSPDEGFTIVWHNSNISKFNLGYQETIKWLNKTVKTCHPSNILLLRERIKAAKKTQVKHYLI